MTPGTKSASKSLKGVEIQVHFKTSGGIAHFPGLNKPQLIDSNQLQAADAQKLQQLIQASGFFELPGKMGSPRAGAADYRTYTIVVESEGRQHTVQAVEPIDNPALAELVAFLRGKKTPHP